MIQSFWDRRCQEQDHLLLERMKVRSGKESSGYEVDRAELLAPTIEPFI